MGTRTAGPGDPGHDSNNLLHRISDFLDGLAADKNELPWWWPFAWWSSDSDTSQPTEGSFLETLMILAVITIAGLVMLFVCTFFTALMFTVVIKLVIWIFTSWVGFLCAIIVVAFLVVKNDWEKY